MVIPYEIHITVQTDDVQAFKQVCDDIGVKPVLIDMQERTGEHIMYDVMTSFTAEYESFTQAWLELFRQYKALSKHFTVTRHKIETVPWHEDAPTKENGKVLENGRHFEIHFGVIVRTPDDEAKLLMLADEFKLHMSKNVFKRYDDGSYCQMLTARSYTMKSEVFQEYSDALTAVFEHRGFLFRKRPRVEFAIWDSDGRHDHAWLNRY